VRAKISERLLRFLSRPDAKSDAATEMRIVREDDAHCVALARAHRRELVEE
jgi:hypothetical protein